jgi:hypothetical protein
MRLPKGVLSVTEIPQDFVPEPLGHRNDLIARIKEVAPDADFSDPSWGLIDGPGYSIEVNIGESDEVDSFALHVRGGDLVIGLIADLLDRLDVGACDPQSDTGIFERDAALASLTRWRAYRDQIVGR